MIGAVAAVILAPPAARAFFAGDYSGNVKGDPTSTAAFSVKSSGEKVKFFITDRVDFTCSIGMPGETEPMRILGSFRINEDREFKGKGETVGIDADPFGKVTGKFKRGGKAAGTLLLRGELDGNAGSQCSTGVVGWRAEKTDF